MERGTPFFQNRRTLGAKLASLQPRHTGAQVPGSLTTY